MHLEDSSEHVLASQGVCSAREETYPCLVVLDGSAHAAACLQPRGHRSRRGT